MSLCAGSSPCPHQGVLSGQGALAPQCHGWGSWGRPVLEMPEGVCWVPGHLPVSQHLAGLPMPGQSRRGCSVVLRSVPEPNASFEPSFVCSGLESDQNKRSWAALLKFGKLRNNSKKYSCKLPLKGESCAAGRGGTGWDYCGGMDGWNRMGMGKEWGTGCPVLQCLLLLGAVMRGTDDHSCPDVQSHPACGCLLWTGPCALVVGPCSLLCLAIQRLPSSRGELRAGLGTQGTKTPEHRDTKAES